MHHGDGVQDAFYHTNRVLTLSFHQYDPDGNFFPGTGAFEEQGEKEGQFCAVNVPLRQGCTDQNFDFLFRTILDRVLETYDPEAVWMQCGADSLKGDRIGGFNLSIEGHGKAVKYVLDKGLPTVFTGGGGYTVENVSRCWSYESCIITNQMQDHFVIPENSKFKNEFKDDDLLFTPENRHGINNDLNSNDYIQKILNKVFKGVGKINNSIPFLEKISREGICQLVDKTVEEEERVEQIRKESEVGNVNHDIKIE